MTGDLARHVRAAAQAIAGNEAPSEWLSSAVHKLADELSYTIRADAKVPSRVELKQQISGIRDASRLISVLLFPFMNGGKANLLLIDHLIQDGEHWLGYEGDLYNQLRDLAERCDDALVRIPSGGGQKRGIAKVVDDKTSSGEIVCALSIQILWKHINGRLPGLNSERAHQACSDLWLAAGGTGTKTAGWRGDMEKARKRRYARDGATLARHVGVQRIHAERG